MLFLVGALVYSFLYWATSRNHAHTFGVIIVALACAVLYK